MSGTYNTIAEFFKALGDPSRLAILDVLKESGEKTPKDIQEAVNKSQSTVSQQLKLLMIANIITARKAGTNRYFKVTDPQIYAIIQQVTQLLSKKRLENVEDLTAQDVKDILL